MKSVLVSLLLFSACATTRVPATPVKGGACQAAKAWPTALKWKVIMSCGKAQIGDLDQCACFADRLEVISPDPTTKATDAEVAASLAACGMEMPTPEPAAEPLSSPEVY